jgi:hypothetical protein
MLTFIVGPLLNPIEVSTGVRPRQSKVTVRGMLIVTPISTEIFRVVTVPELSKSMVTEYVDVSTCWMLVTP